MNSRIAQRIDGLALLCAVAIALGGAAGCGRKSLQDDGGAGAGGASLGGRGAGGSRAGGDGGIAGGAAGAGGACDSSGEQLFCLPGNGATVDYCGDFLMPATCSGGQWVCPPGQGVPTRCRCPGLGSPTCVCGSDGWQCGTGGAAGQSGAGGWGGAGGSAGGGGSGGMSGTPGGAGSGGMSGTTGGAGFGGFQPPGCLRDLFAPCSIAGSCAYQTDDAGNPGSRCYASGARSTSTGFRCTTNGPSVETATITKPDGTLCYTVSISASPSQACEYETYRWSDASGATVATGTLGYASGISIRCEVGGETAMRSGGIQPYPIFTSGQCSPGNCP